ncbi:hypothetical protein DFQ26_002997 [Actinomortierella ambigua]|nr:hypothetical protein DFQ26_002997 [Actinomortierella ambigua]
MDRQLRIMDWRQGSGDSEATLLAEAHRGPIRDIQWSPYIPYWLASCGDDGQIKVWDLRFQSRAMVELGEYGQGFYQSLAWSNTHCDIISSSSRDRAFQVWKLGIQWSLDEDEFVAGSGTGATRPGSSRMRPLSGGHLASPSSNSNSISSSSAATAAMTLELAKLGTMRRSAAEISSLSAASHSMSHLPHYQGVGYNSSKVASGSHHKVVKGTQVAIVRDMSDASIAQIVSSNQDPGTFLTVTSAGVLATHTLRPSTLDTLAPHRDPGNNYSREYGVERSLYHRNLTDVCDQLLDWVRSGEHEEDNDKKTKWKGGPGDKEAKSSQGHAHINPREMLDMMMNLPPASLSSKSWKLARTSAPTTPVSPAYPAGDQLQVPQQQDGDTLSPRRRRFSAQVISTDRSRSRSPSAKSINNEMALLCDQKLDPAHLAAFIEDFERYTLKQLPPGFPMRLATRPLPTNLERQIANVTKHAQFVKLARSRQAHALVERFDEISDMALRDPVTMDIASLSQILSCVMDWDHVQGLRMARTLVGLLSSPPASHNASVKTAADAGEDAPWWALVHMALFPTVFDRSMVHCGPEAYEGFKAVRASGRRQMLERLTLTFNESKRRSFTSLRTPVLQDFETAQGLIARSGSIATILDMIDFEIQVQSILAREPHSIPAHIVLELFHPTEYQESKMTISQQAMSIYFDAASLTGQWGDYFETIQRILRDFSFVILDSQGQPNDWLSSSIKANDEARMAVSSLLTPPSPAHPPLLPVFHGQGSPPSTLMTSPMSMSNYSNSTSPSASQDAHHGLPQSSSSAPHPPPPPPPAMISHFLWAHFDRFGLPALRSQLGQLLDLPPQVLMETHPIVFESWIMALGRLIKVWWGGDKVPSSVVGSNGGGERGGGGAGAFGSSPGATMSMSMSTTTTTTGSDGGDGSMTLVAAALGGAPMAKVVLARRQLEFQFDALAGRFFQRIAVCPANPEQTRANAERQANSLMDQLRSNGLLKRKHQHENPVPEADRLYQALVGFLRAGSIGAQ